MQIALVLKEDAFTDTVKVGFKFTTSQVASKEVIDDRLPLTMY